MDEKNDRGLCDSELMRRVAGLLSSQLHERGLAISLSGIDGSGKSTLARQLIEAFEASEIPARYLHVHNWYLNVLVTPAVLLYNRRFGRKVLVFDRTIYDNIAVASVRRYVPKWLSRLALTTVLACYPKFNYRFYLVIAFTETLARRPDTDRKRFMLLSKVYDEIGRRVNYIQFRSDGHLFSAVLGQVAGVA